VGIITSRASRAALRFRAIASDQPRRFSTSRGFVAPSRHANRGAHSCEVVPSHTALTPAGADGYRGVMRVVPVLLMLAACATGTGDPPAEDPDARVAGTEIDANLPFVDAMPDPIDAEGAMPDAMVIVGGVVDTCAQGMNLTTAASVAGGTTVTGNTTGYADDLRPTGTCTGYLPDGPDAVYLVNATAGQTLSATVTDLAPGWDISIYVTQTCVLNPTCLTGADLISGSGAEGVTHAVAAAGTYYVIVDGWNPGVQGPYSLAVTLQ